MDQPDAEASSNRINCSTTKVEGPPLVVVYWNVAGIRANAIDQGLAGLENEVEWVVLTLLDFL